MRLSEQGVCTCAAVMVLVPCLFGTCVCACLQEEDPSLLAVSAWNDNGFRGVVRDPLALRRTSYFPGLGWLLTRRLYESKVRRAAAPSSFVALRGRRGTCPFLCASSSRPRGRRSTGITGFGTTRRLRGCTSSFPRYSVPSPPRVALSARPVLAAAQLLLVPLR
jgi:hypothetical protein